MSSQEGYICLTHTVEVHGLHSPSWDSETVSGFQEWELRKRHHRSPEQWNGAPSTPHLLQGHSFAARRVGLRITMNMKALIGSQQRAQVNVLASALPILPLPLPSSSSMRQPGHVHTHVPPSNQRPSHSSAWEIDSDGSLLGSLARLPLFPQYQLTSPSLHPPHTFRMLRWRHFPPYTNMCLPASLRSLTNQGVVHEAAALVSP